jgi:hypothetical protein
MPGMKPSELFGVVVRSIGLLIVIYGLYELWGGVDNTVENLLAIGLNDNGDQPSSFGYFAFGVPALVFGTVVFFAADLIVRLAYRDSGA